MFFDPGTSWPCSIIWQLTEGVPQVPKEIQNFDTCLYHQLYIEPRKSLPVDTLDNSGPLQWRLGKPLTPMKPVVISILKSYGEVCERYFCHFKQKQHGVFI
jgi:hypothetical protein